MLGMKTPILQDEDNDGQKVLSSKSNIIYIYIYIYIWFSDN